MCPPLYVFANLVSFDHVLHKNKVFTFIYAFLLYTNTKAFDTQTDILNVVIMLLRYAKYGEFNVR